MPYVALHGHGSHAAKVASSNVATTDADTIVFLLLCMAASVTNSVIVTIVIGNLLSCL